VQARINKVSLDCRLLALLEGLNETARPLIASGTILDHTRQEARMPIFASRKQDQSDQDNGSPHLLCSTSEPAHLLFPRRAGEAVARLRGLSQQIRPVHVVIWGGEAIPTRPSARRGRPEMSKNAQNGRA
jgi:hypothetical protein